MSLFLCYYHIFSFYIFKWVVFHWCWVGFMYGQKIQQLFFRTDGLQERITDYLGLFSFVLHFEYYSTELEIFFFCPLSQPLAKVIQFHQAFLDLHALSAHLFFLPLCHICFDKGPWQNEYSISPCFSFDWHNLFCFLLVLVLQLVLDEYNKSQLWSTPANMHLTTCSEFWLHHDLSAVSQPLSL